MNKNIVVIKFISSDKSLKFVLTVRDKNASLDMFTTTKNYDQCTETVECYTTVEENFNYEYKDNRELCDEVNYFIEGCFQESVAAVLGIIVQGILVNNPKNTVSITFNDDLKLLCDSLEDSYQKQIS